MKLSSIVSAITVLILAHGAKADQILWTQGSPEPKIRCMNLDGSNVQDLITGGVTNPSGIAIDPCAAKMYWVDGTFVRRAVIAQNAPIEELFTLPGGLHDVVLDIENGKMYISDGGDMPAIYVANIDPPHDPIVLHVFDDDCAPGFMAIDPCAAKLYWILNCPGSGQVQRSNLDGSGLATLLTTDHGHRDIRLDVTAGKLYLTSNFPGHIERANLNGSGLELLVQPPVGGTEAPYDLELHVAAGQMYWSDIANAKVFPASMTIPAGETPSNRTDIETISTGFVAAGMALNVIECQDCDTNGLNDWQDLQCSNAADCNTNSIPDECETDCNTNGLADECEATFAYSSLPSAELGPFDADHPQTHTLMEPPQAASDVVLTFMAKADLNDPREEFFTVTLNGKSFDMNVVSGGQSCPAVSGPFQITVPAATWNALVNGGDAALTMTPSSETSACTGSYVTVGAAYTALVEDCNSNGILDECDPDCDSNAVPDDCEEATPDCNTNGIKDPCEPPDGDCNTNTIPDECDIADGTSPDCNTNAIPDECDIAGSTSADCNTNAAPDLCEILSGSSTDCNTNAQIDPCDVYGPLDLLTVNAVGQSAEEWCFDPAISSDARLVAFYTDAANLLPNDSNAARDVLMLDRDFGTFENVHVASDGGLADDAAFATIDMTPDGRYVAFVSEASNLVPDGISSQIYLRDRLEGTTEIVSVSTDGEPAPGLLSFAPAVSDDGRYVAFYSIADNLVPDDTNGVADVLRRDRQTGETIRISVNSMGEQGNGHSGLNVVDFTSNFYVGTHQVVISADGRYVAFGSEASNLVPNDTNDARDVFIYDCDIGVMERISISSDGDEGNAGSSGWFDAQWAYPAGLDMTSDGRYVAFDSWASNLVDDDPNGNEGDIFVRDRQLLTTVRVPFDSQLPNTPLTWNPVLSDDGRYVVFASNRQAVLPGQHPSSNLYFTNVFEFDFIGGPLTLVSANLDDQGANDVSGSPPGVSPITPDGRHIIFSSEGTNLVNTPTDNIRQIYARDRLGGNECNTNLVPDACEPDCNTNGVPDECDLPTSPDCNTNGIPDECEVTFTFAAESGALSPFEYGSAQQFTITSPPPANGIIKLTFITRADLDHVKEFIEVELDDMLIGLLFVETGGQCPETPDTAALTVDAATWNAARADGSIVINMTASHDVGGIECDSFISVQLEYSAPDSDCNANGVLDVCEPDCNTNSISDECDITDGGSEDCNTSAVPDECEILIPGTFISSSGPLGPIACGIQQTFVITRIPIAISDVSLTFSARASLASSSQYIAVFINRVAVGYVFVDGGSACPAVADTETLIVPASIFNGAAEGGQAHILMVASRGVLQPCTGSFISVSINYEFSDYNDCNSNNQLDECDLASGSALDCQSDGIPDACELLPPRTFAATSGILSPIHSGFPQRCSFVAPPAASSDVILSFTASADLDATNEFISVDINGTPVGTVYQTGGSSCASVPDISTLIVPAATFNGALAGGNAVIHMTPSGPVDTQCSNSFITAAMTYHYASNDCNSNAVPDDCEIDLEGLPDCDEDGMPDICETDCNTNGLADDCEIDPDHEYVVDDGSAERGVGVYPYGDLIWLNQFDVSSGTEVITDVEVVLWNVDVGSTMWVVIWDDPNNDGQPYDAEVLVTSGPFAIDSLAIEAAFPPTVVGNVGDSFFAGALVACPQFDPFGCPAALDQSAPSPMRSWVVPASCGDGDITDLPGNIAPIDNVYPGNWLIRCNAHSHDCNTNGELDLCELENNALMDCDQNDILDQCEPQSDCNTNGIGDACDIFSATSEDCATNSIPDECDTAGLPVIMTDSAATVIRDAPTLFSSFTVGLPGAVADVNVGVDIQHSVDADLDVLLSHAGITVELFTDVGGGGDNFTGTVLDEDSPTPITSGSPPFTGNFNPEGNLDLFNNIDAAGPWTLSVDDDAFGNTGTLLSWTLFFANMASDCDANDVPDVCEIASNDCNTNGKFDGCEVVQGEGVSFVQEIDLALPDDPTVFSDVVVVDSRKILDLDVGVDIRHTFDGDLDVFLIHLDTATTAELFTDVGGSSDNFTGTMLDEDAATPITSGVPPFTGTFDPEGNLDDFDGQAVAGSWRLSIDDDATGNTGTLLSWSLSLLLDIDCNTNTIPDGCDIASGASTDVNGDGIPDECQFPACSTCAGDINADAFVDADDIQGFVVCLFAYPPAGLGCGCANQDGDGDVDSSDLALFVAKLLLSPPPCP